jgi:hypothetical protein
MIGGLLKAGDQGYMTGNADLTGHVSARPRF